MDEVIDEGLALFFGHGVPIKAASSAKFAQTVLGRLHALSLPVTSLRGERQKNRDLALTG